MRMAVAEKSPLLGAVVEDEVVVAVYYPHVGVLCKFNCLEVL